MNETPQHNPANIEKKEIKKDISSLLKDAENIYKSWKQADKTDNENWITNKDTREKYLYFKEKWENIKNNYDEIKNWSTSERNKLIEEIENMKREHRKYESISTIATIFFYLNQKNKNWKLDKVLQNLNVAKNIEEITKNPKNILILLKKLEYKTWKIPNWEVSYNYIVSPQNKNLSQEEKDLYSFLEPIKNFYKYAEEWGIKLDLNKDNKIFKKELKNFEELEKKYNSKNKENKNNNNKKETKQETNQTINKNLENYIKLENWVYNSDSSIITLNNSKKWTIKTIKVPDYDKKILKPDNIENYIKIYENFEKAWISKLIKFLPQISATIWWNINYNDDFLKENELKQVLNSILISTWYKSIDEKKDLKEFINIFSNFKNKKQYWWYKDNLYKIWKSTIEEKFLENFVTNKIKFESKLFKEKIQIQKKS